MITIIIPYFNAENTLLNVALSLVDQLFSGAELLLVDDGSDDKSSLYFSEINRRAEKKGVVVSQIILEANSGLLAARIAGAKAAKFSYVGFLDADDYLFNIDRAELELIALNNYDVALYRFLYCDQQLRVHDELIPPANLSAATAFKDNLLSWKFTTMGLYRKDFYLAGENVFAPQLACAEEVYFKYIFSKVKNIFCARIKYFYVQNPSSISKSLNVKNLTKILSYDSFVKRLKEDGCSSNDIFLASTCTLNIAHEQMRTILSVEGSNALILGNALQMHANDVFWKRRAWIDCFHFAYPWVSLKNIVKLVYLLLFCVRSR